MFRWIVATSLKLRFIVVALAAVMVLYGIDRIERMPLDVFPEFAPPRIEIQTPGLGLSAEEAEELLTIPLEHALKGVAGLDILRSRTVTGLSTIELIFKPEIDLIDARQLVQERLRTVAPHLPVPNTAPVVQPPISSVSRVMQIAVTSRKIALEELSMLAFWRVRFRLMSVPGVANVVIWGHRNTQLILKADPERLRAHAIPVEQLNQATAAALNVSLLKYTTAAKGAVDGWIEFEGKRLLISHKLPITTAQELGEIVIKKHPDGRAVRVKDVATVTYESDTLIGEAVTKDGPGLLMVIEKFPWANTLQVTHGIEAAIAELRPGMPDVDFYTNFRPATFVEQSIANLTHAMIVGAALVVLVLVFFLFEWRVALISTVAIPLSLVAAGLILYWQGATVNTMVLAGLFVGLGSVVDDAIIDIENILRRLRLNRQLPEAARLSTARVVLDASLEVRQPIVYATLIIVLSVTPVLFFSGLLGAFFQPLAVAYILALLASMVVALTVTPALALILLRDAPLEVREPVTVASMKRGYMSVLGAALAAPAVPVLATVALTLLGLIVWPLLGEAFMPEFKERDVLVRWIAKPGASRETMVRSTDRVRDELAAVPGLRPTFASHIGRSIMGGPEVVGMNYGEHWISIAPDADYDKTRAAVDRVIDNYPGILRGVHTYIRERIKDVISGASESIVVRIYGPELSGLRAAAAQVRGALWNVEGLDRLRVELQNNSPQLRIRVDVAAAARHGLKPGDVRRSVSTIMAGQETTDVYSEGMIYGVMVWSVPEARASLDALASLLIDTPDGKHVRLSDVAQIRIVPAPPSIRREGSSRRIDVSANLSGSRDLGSVVHEIEHRLKAIKFPLEYRAELIGEYQERQALQSRLRWITIAAVIGILLLLQVSFRSWRLAWLTFLSMPAALVGGVLAVLVTSGEVSLGALVGFLTVLGIAARNGILLIHHYLHLQAEEGMPFGRDLVLRGASERLAPIMMTTLSTGLALLPLALSGNLPGHEIEHPMAVVILGGLVTSTLLNLFVVPQLYMWFGDAGPGVTRPQVPVPVKPAMVS
ncbi:MAG: efflux RND transporter permease subunit [Hyphomicrobiaceae bacterium]|nr:efflux RND transporter permease subunit [Hyphomicrobiaceae bacterium]